MAAVGSETEEIRVLRLGGKGSTLRSSSVFHFAKSITQLIIESSARSRPSSVGHSASSPSSKVSITVPEYLSSAEARASLLLLLNKLLLSSPAAAFELSAKISDNSRSYEISAGDLPPFFDYSAAAFDGIAALLDHSSSVLATVIDAVAALSCEALGADITAFNLIDSGDGSSAKDDVAVASDFKVFFNGSKLASTGGKGKLIDAVSSIPAVHGSFREICRLWHSRIRVQLSSGFRARAAEPMYSHLLALADSLFNLADISFSRAKLLVESKPELDPILKAQCSSCPYADCYQKLLLMLLEQKFKRNNYDYARVSNQVYVLLNEVWKIVSLEATLAFLTLEEIQSSGSLNADDRKSEKRKKVVMGKGSTVLMHFIKESFLSRGSEKTPATPASGQNVFLSLDPSESGFDSLLNKVKEIVESNESRRLPKLPKGTRDFAKEQMAIRERAFTIITEVFKRHGATALDTPAFELRETLMGKYGEDSKLIYDLADQGGELCSLRYDLTVPFARYVAMNGLTSFKRYQIAKVYRRDNPSKGRYREFYQCDFDIAGQFEKMGPDFEVIKILTELLNELDIGDYEVKLNHRRLLDGMLAICGVPPEKFRTICSSIDKLDKQSFDQVKREMVSEKGLTHETADAIGTFVKERGSPMELLHELKKEGSKFLENTESRLALEELEILFKALEKSKCIDKVVFDLSLARGLDYYTGVIFEAVFKGATQVGSIAAGGRYDNLIGMFGTKQVPAVGISLGIERVFSIMEQIQKEQNQAIRATETQVLASILGEDLSLGAEIASELWGAKVKTEFMVDKRIKKQLARANDSGIPFMVIVGEHELNEGKVKLKDLSATKEYDIPRCSLVEEVSRRLSGVPV